MKLPFPRTYVLGYVPRRYTHRDQKVPSVYCSRTEDSWDFSLIPQLAEEKKLPDAMGHLHGAGHLPCSSSEGNCCYGDKEKGEQDFPVSYLKVRYPWGAPLKCLVDQLVRVMGLDCVFILIP